MCGDAFLQLYITKHFEKCNESYYTYITCIAIGNELCKTIAS